MGEQFYPRIAPRTKKVYRETDPAPAREGPHRQGSHRVCSGRRDCHSRFRLHHAGGRAQPRGKKHLTIITNDLFIATEITYHPSTTVIVTGGILRPGFNVVVGSATESFLMSVHVDKSFLGGDAVDFDYGLTNATLSEASVKQLMIKAAKKPISWLIIRNLASEP